TALLPIRGESAGERRKRKMRDPDGPRMNVLGFADFVAAGQAAQRRVFIRADLNVPQAHSPEGGGRITEDSLAPIAARLAELLGRAVPLRTDWVDGVAVAPGEVVVLENCRLNKGEKKNDPALAKKMAALCDIYANDAFGTAHRAEATTEGIARYAKTACAGPLMAQEIEALTQ